MARNVRREQEKGTGSVRESMLVLRETVPHGACPLLLRTTTSRLARRQKGDRHQASFYRKKRNTSLVRLGASPLSADSLIRAFATVRATGCAHSHCARNARTPLAYG